MTEERYTTNYGLVKPNFNRWPWHDKVNNNWELIDNLIFALTGVSALSGVWENNTAYVVGDRVIDILEGTIWTADVTHTSAGSGTFAEDRAAHPTYWAQFLGGLVWRGEWQTGTQYFANDLVSHSGNSYICNEAHTSGTFATDLGNNFWDLFPIGLAPATASDVAFTPTGAVVASNVQDAIAELDTEKLSSAIAASTYQPLDPDLTAIALQGVSLFGLGLLLLDDAEDLRDTADIPPYVTTRTALKALDTTKETVAYLAEGGRSGMFVWTTGDFSDQVAADTQEAIYIEANAVADTLGAWVRHYNDKASPHWFGAKGDGITITASCSITSGTAALTVAGASFLPTDVGKSINVSGAGAASGVLHTTIAGYTSATQVTLGNNASTTLSAVSKQVVYGTDDAVALQACLDIHLPVFLPPLVFLTSQQLNFTDASHLEGTMWNRQARTTVWGTDDGVFSEIKYIGVGGTHSTVIRFADRPVGSMANDITPPGTSDLRNAVFERVNVHANNLADIGIYYYRASAESFMRDVSAQNAKKRNIIILGAYTSDFGMLHASYCEEHGMGIGEDYFGWGSVESDCYSINARILTVFNGTAGTFVKNDATHDTDGSGAWLCVGRGSRIQMDSEANDGRACIIETTRSNFTDGPTFYNIQYIEGNGAGPRINYESLCTRHVIHDGFFNINQDVKIVAMAAGVVTDDLGPSDSNRWLEFNNIFGSDVSNGFVVDSNTGRYWMRTCTHNIQISNRAPARFDDRVASQVLSGSAVALTTNITANVTSIDVPAGIWEITAAIGFTAGVTTSVTQISGSISETSATHDTTGQGTYYADKFAAIVYGSGANFLRNSIGPARKTIIAASGTTTIYLTAQATFTVSNIGAFGYIAARRVYS